VTWRRFWLFVRLTFRESSGVYNAISFAAFGLGMTITSSIIGGAMSPRLQLLGLCFLIMGLALMVITFCIAFHFLNKRYPLHDDSLPKS